METIHGIRTRRSIREFTGKVLEDRVLEEIAALGFFAPTAHNLQPQEFIVFKDKKTLEQLGRDLKYAKGLKTSGAGILVMADTRKQPEPGFYVADTAAAIQNILLGIHAMGYGGVWIGVYPVEEYIQVVKETFGIPGHYMPVGLIALGEPVTAKEGLDRKDASRIHWEKF
ncbi:MAG: hypothetical protein AVO33_08960 [delta proteobacterium ML8_F1]|nr:MAG: hypothetical protein AVO33_08960 [delta proteobacterium ML8_F1]